IYTQYVILYNTLQINMASLRPYPTQTEPNSYATNLEPSNDSLTLTNRPLQTVVEIGTGGTFPQNTFDAQNSPMKNRQPLQDPAIEPARKELTQDVDPRVTTNNTRTLAVV